jgi:hypothetical protein
MDAMYGLQDGDSEEEGESDEDEDEDEEESDDNDGGFLPAGRKEPSVIIEDVTDKEVSRGQTGVIGGLLALLLGSNPWV